MKPMILPKKILDLLEMMEDAGYECYVVGGAVRSHLLNEPIHDYDLTTSATPEEMLELFHDFKTLTVGMKHGTITVIIDHEPIEITTYRKEEDYLDHRHPSTVSFTRNIKDDLARRDFTINAIAYHPKTGYFDPFQGLEDLNKRQIQTVNNPYERFNEDALRILRAIRFQSRLNFKIEDSTHQAMVKLAPTLDYLSKERIQHEFEEILTNKYCGYAIQDNLDVLNAWCKESFKNDGLISFLKHQQTMHSYKHISVALGFSIFAYDLLMDPIAFFKAKLKPSKNQIAHIKACLSFDTIDFQDIKALKHLKKDTQDSFETVLMFQGILQNQSFQDIEKIIQSLEHEPCCIKDLTINGSDLIKLGFQGKQISYKLEECLNKVLDGKLENNKMKLLEYVKKTD